MRLMTSLRWNAGQTFRGLKSTGSDFVMSVMLAGLALTLPFFIACVWLSVADLSFSMPKTEVTVFTERTASLASVKKIQKSINDLAGVAETRLLTREKALELVNQNLGVKDRGNTNNTLPDIIIVTVGSNMSSAATAELDTAIKKIPGVVSTAFDAEWAENLARFQSAAWPAALILGAVILLLCVLVIMSSIRMTTRAQNEEIRALNTFGAEVSFIAAPYGWRGAITLTAAALVSIGISWLGVGILAQPVTEFAAINNVSVTLSLLRPDYLVIYVVVCAVLGYASGLSAASSEIRKVQNEQTF